MIGLFFAIGVGLAGFSMAIGWTDEPENQIGLVLGLVVCWPIALFVWACWVAGLYVRIKYFPIEKEGRYRSYGCYFCQRRERYPKVERLLRQYMGRELPKPEGY